MEPEQYNEDEDDYYDYNNSIEDIYYISNIVEDNDIDSLIHMLNNRYINLNDLQGMTSPLISAVAYRNYPEMIDIMLIHGADPNIDDGSGYTVFTRILMTMLQTLADILDGIHPTMTKDEYIEYINSVLILLLDNEIPIDFLKGNRNNNAINVLDRWDTEYSYTAVVNRHRGRRNFVSENKDIEAKNIIKDIINNILDEKEKYNLYKVKQRSSLAKTGLPQNLIDTIVGELDADAFNKLGESLKDRQEYSKHPYNKLDSFYRYNPDEPYEEHLENKNWAEMADFYDQYGGKISQKKYQKLLKDNKNKKLTKKNRKLLNKTLNKKYCSCVKKVRRTLNKKQKGAEYPICTKSIYNNRNIKPPKNKNNNCK